MKKWLLLMFVIMSTIAYSQPNKTRIEDILNPQKPMSEVEKDKLKSRLNSEAELSSACIDKLFEAKSKIDSLDKEVKHLKAVNDQQHLDVIESSKNESLAQETMSKEHNSKKRWVKSTIGEGAIIIGGIVGLATGVWVPICIAVGITELYLFVEGKVQISIKQTKI
jgi:hypothetical protein